MKLLLYRCSCIAWAMLHINPVEDEYMDCIMYTSVSIRIFMWYLSYDYVSEIDHCSFNLSSCPFELNKVIETTLIFMQYPEIDLQHHFMIKVAFIITDHMTMIRSKYNNNVLKVDLPLIWFFLIWKCYPLHNISPLCKMRGRWPRQHFAWTHLLQLSHHPWRTNVVRIF